MCCVVYAALVGVISVLDDMPCLLSQVQARRHRHHHRHQSLQAPVCACYLVPEDVIP